MATFKRQRARPDPGLLLFGLPGITASAVLLVGQWQAMTRAVGRLRKLVQKMLRR